MIYIVFTFILIFIAIVKANSYGYGLASIATKIQNRIDRFRTSSIDESIILRDAGIKSETILASDRDIQITINNFEKLDWLENIQSLSKKLNIWIKIDTGMGRLGFLFDYLLLIENIFIKLKNLKFVNGLSPTNNKSAKEFNLKPVMQLETEIMSTKVIKRVNSVGYGVKYVCDSDTKIGIIPIGYEYGYGEGYLRALKFDTPVLVGSKICTTIGKSMDMTIVNLTNCPECKSNERVVLRGWDLPIERIAEASCSPYDLLTVIQNRVKVQWI